LLLARSAQLERALRLAYFTIGWNAIEAIVGTTAGLAAGSVALLGFALDSVVESSSGGVVLWRLRSEISGRRTAEEAERRAVRAVAVAFFALAAYVGGQAVYNLATRAEPDPSPVGIGLAAVSLLVMPVLAWRKRLAARSLDSATVRADSTQTLLCVALSLVLLVGLGANALWGWWWADPIAALTIAGVAANEGRELWTTEDFCC
jgi:divalent metal cation (Fe/Co/Zn/Cd) transporter